MGCVGCLGPDMEGCATVEVFEYETENVKVSSKVGGDFKK